MDLEPPREALEQERRRARVGDLVVDRLAVARLPAAGQEHALAVDHQAGAELVDVGGLAEQARVLHHLRLAASGLDDDLDARPEARLERAGGQEREAAVAVAEQRAAPAEQRPVEVRVDTAQRHAG